MAKDGKLIKKIHEPSLTLIPQIPLNKEASIVQADLVQSQDLPSPSASPIPTETACAGLTWQSARLSTTRRGRP